MNPNSNSGVRENIVVSKSFEFALGIIEFCGELDSMKKFAVSNQLIRSGTSIGANIREAQGAESKRDFTHKMRISLKEAEETNYWLSLCNEAIDYPKPNQLLGKSLELIKILNAIVHSSKTGKA